MLPSAHAVDREYRVLGALAESAVPVPRTLLYCADRAIVGTPFYVMERLEGRVFGDVTLRDVPRSERATLYDAMCTTLAALHAIDPADVGLADYGKPGTITRARSRAGRGSGSCRRRATSHRSSGSLRGCRRTCRRAMKRAWRTGITG